MWTCAVPVSTRVSPLEPPSTKISPAVGKVPHKKMLNYRQIFGWWLFESAESYSSRQYLGRASSRGGRPAARTGRTARWSWAAASGRRGPAAGCWATRRCAPQSPWGWRPAPAPRPAPVQRLEPAPLPAPALQLVLAAAVKLKQTVKLLCATWLCILWLIARHAPSSSNDHLFFDIEFTYKLDVNKEMIVISMDLAKAFDSLRPSVDEEAGKHCCEWCTAWAFVDYLINRFERVKML